MPLSELQQRMDAIERAVQDNNTSLRERVLMLEQGQANKVDYRELGKVTETMALLNNTVTQLIARLAEFATREDISKLSMSIEYLTTSVGEMATKADVKSVEGKANSANATAWKLFGATMTLVTFVATTVFIWIQFLHK